MHPVASSFRLFFDGLSVTLRISGQSEDVGERTRMCRRTDYQATTRIKGSVILHAFPWDREMLARHLGPFRGFRRSRVSPREGYPRGIPRPFACVRTPRRSLGSRTRHAREIRRLGAGALRETKVLFEISRSQVVMAALGLSWLGRGSRAIEASLGDLVALMDSR